MKQFYAALLAILPYPCIAQTQPLPDTRTKQALVDSLSHALNHYYVYPDKADGMSRHIAQQLRNNRYDSASSAAELANQLNKDLRTIYNDKHLVIRFDPDLQKRIIAFNTTKRSDPADQQREQRQNYFFRKLEILPSNIGYLEFTNFADTSAAARKTIRAALQFLEHTDAIIIDLRNNYGGNGILAGEFAGFFFDKKIFGGRSYNRLTNQWTDQWLQNNPAVTQGLYMNMPIYLLTSHRTFSAAEGLAYTLQTLRKATVVGDTTRGGAHLTRSFSLGNGFVGFIPFTRHENAVTHTDWEGTGVLPDVYASENNSLPQAQKLILQRQLTTTTHENEQRKIQWQINYLTAQQPAWTPTANELKTLAGEFEEFVFLVRDGQLVCVNKHQSNQTNRLVSIERNLFQVNASMQVAFFVNDQGLADTVKLYWNDGWVDTIKRTGP
ncbi:S41 family peptidase [Paraflavitalea pollutisoli]|uniref:S41 family peptidase n=1 Tax=Paraflavitalea pollutisoli TaxID=3034143 RepID=UPI0023EDCCF8|nr:S41 family peptidase [Paraflavitalea sp. H1-2-19X]